MWCVLCFGTIYAVYSILIILFFSRSCFPLFFRYDLPHLSRFTNDSPIIGLTVYGIEQDDSEPSCGPRREEFWTKFYYAASFTLFFLIPCIILLVLYALIAQHLIREPARIGNPTSAGMSSSTSATSGITCGENHLVLGSGNVSRQPRRRNRLQRHQNSNRARR